MSMETPPAEPQSWPVLNVTERRVLGVLVEKAKTTPDVYPLSMNSIVTASNQKSNRDPLLGLADHDVEEALGALQQRGLVTRITGSRVDRWRHNLYEVWQVDKVELAILAELLLRGAQTEGELRSRAGRMEPIDDLETLRQKLKPLAGRGLIAYHGEEGRRGTQIMHGFCSPTEQEVLRASGPAGGRAEETHTLAPAATAPDKTTELAAALAVAQQDIAALKMQVEELRNEIRQLKS